MDQASNRLAFLLGKTGVAPGDRVATMLDNSVDAVCALLAIVKLGAVAVPLNTALRMEFLRRPVTDSGAAVFVIDADYIDRFAAIGEALPSSAVLVVRGEADASPLMAQGACIIPLSAAAAGSAAAQTDRSQPSDLAFLLYTSGTTGPAKGCMISQNYLCNLARMCIRSLAVRADDVFWTPLPVFHQNALTQVLAAATIGARIVLERRFSLSGFWPQIEAAHATVASILGSIIPLVAVAEETDAARRCHGQLRVVNGAPFPASLRETWRRRFGVGWAGASGYGMTEAALVTSIEGPEELPEAASGRLNDQFEVQILDDAGAPAPIGVAGQLVCRPRHSNIMFDGYWRAPEATAKVMRDGWFHTGDIGKLDDRGCLYFLGRKKEYLRRRGENVSLFELDAAVLRHPDLEDVASFAVPSALGEDDIKIAAVRRPGSPLTEADLYDWCTGQLPYFALPTYIEFVVDLPRNPLGKIQKFVLANRPLDARTWRRPDERDSGHAARREAEPGR
jgi:crotonobetaine/carnitine-CoA ligase